jgi:hypothetical protein
VIFGHSSLKHRAGSDPFPALIRYIHGVNFVQPPAMAVFMGGVISGF